MSADADDQTTPAVPTPDAPTSAADDVKRKFKEALAAKKGRRGEDHLDAGQQPVHAHGPVEAKRTFRRKTG